MTYTFKLVPNAKYHNIDPLNGRTLVAADVKASYERYAAGGPQASYFANMDRIDAVDPTTLKITMKRPVADFIMPLAGRYIPIIPPEVVDSGNIERTAIGTGPLILKEATDGQHVLFDKNPEYWARPVLLDGLEFKIMPDPAARLAAFRAKQIDYGYPFVDNLTDAKNLQKTNPDVHFYMSSPLNTTFTRGVQPRPAEVQGRPRAAGPGAGIDHDTIIGIVLEKLGRSCR